MSETTSGALAKALAAFQGEMPTVEKAKTADTGKYQYSYADLADVTKAAMPLLARHDLAFTALPSLTEGGWVLTGTLMHSSGEQITGTLPLVTGGPQQVGSSLTYMRRYLLGCLTGIVTDDDDDGQRAQHSRQERTAKPRSGQRSPDWEAPRDEAEVARAELLGWIKSRDLTVDEAVARWAAEHDNEHIKDAMDAAGIRAMQAAWQQDLDAQRSEQ